MGYTFFLSFYKKSLTRATPGGTVSPNNVCGVLISRTRRYTCVSIRNISNYLFFQFNLLIKSMMIPIRVVSDKIFHNYLQFSILKKQVSLSKY